VEVLVNRVISIRRLGRVRTGQLRRFHDSMENGIRVMRSWMFKIPGNEKLNTSRWIRSTVRLFDKYSRSFGKPDILLAHSAIWAGCAASVISRIHGIPFLITEHRSFFVFTTGESRQMLRPFYRPLLREAYNRCNRLVIVSESMKKGLLELDPHLKNKMKVIPNMVDGNFFSLPVNPRPRHPFVFITAGRLIHVKGYDILIRALAKIIQNGHQDIILKILGRGEENTRLEKLATNLGIRKNVIFTGRLSRVKVRDEFHNAHCFVLSSRYEAFGVVLIEAMATGLPVIATRSGGPSEIVKPGCGYLADPGSEDELVRAMLEMFAKYDSFDPEMIRKKILNQYGKEAIAGQYIHLMEEFVKKSVLEDFKDLV